MSLVAAAVFVGLMLAAPNAVAAPIDVCDLATPSEIESYRGLEVVAEGYQSQGNANSLRAKGAGEGRVWVCYYEFVNPPPDVFGSSLSLGVFTDDMPDIPISEIYLPPADYIVVLPIPVGDEGYWMYDDDSIRGGIAPLVNPLWARVGDCWFEFTGDLGAEHPGDGIAEALLATAQTVAARLAEADCMVTAGPGSGSATGGGDDSATAGGGSGPTPGGDDARTGDDPTAGVGDEEGGGEDTIAGGRLAGPPSIVRTRAFTDLRTPGTVDTGDLIFLVFSEAMDIGIDRDSTLTVLDGDGTLADLSCDQGIDCTFIVEGDVVDGTVVGNAQAMGLLVTAHSDTFRTHQDGGVPGLQYPLTIMSASSEYVDQEGLDLDVVRGDRIIESEGAETEAESRTVPWVPVVAVGALLAAAGVMVGRRLVSRPGVGGTGG